MSQQPLGETGHLAARFRRGQLEVEHARLLARIATETDTPIERASKATAAGDSRKLRGIPAIGRGVAGAIHNTTPHHRVPLSPASGLRHALRSMLIQRDGTRCYLCSRELSDAESVIEHIIPKSRGGTDDPTNLAISCSLCNNYKGDKFVSIDITSGTPRYHATGRTMALNRR